MQEDNEELPRITSDDLEDMSAIEFNDRIVALSVFLCKRCHKFLSPPIMLLAGVGNVCGACNTADASTNAVHNSAIELILQNLMIPCRNESVGCREQFEYLNMPAHELRCKYRKYLCPLRQFVECKWEGVFDILWHHCFREHRKFIIMARTTRCFKVIVNIHVHTSDIVKLLYPDDDSREVFVLHVRCDIKAQKLHYTVYCIKELLDASEYFYSLERIGGIEGNSCWLRCDPDRLIVEDMEFTRDVDDNRSSSIDLSVLKGFISKTNVSTLIKLSTKHFQSEKELEKYSDQWLLDLISHHPSKWYMKLSKIQGVDGGHSMYLKYGIKFDSCPQCNAKLQIREPCNSHRCVGRDLQFSCSYLYTNRLLATQDTDITEHKAECTLQPLGCIFSCDFDNQCLWAGTYSTIILHLKTCHKKTVILNNYSKLKIGIVHHAISYSYYIMIAYGQIFYIFRREDLINKKTNKWVVRVKRIKRKDEQYKYEIGVIYSTNKNRTHIGFDLCKDLTFADDIFHQCITLPSTTACLDDEITYYCKITPLIAVAD